MILLANTTLSDQLGAVSHTTLTQGHPLETATTFGNIASHIAGEKERGKGVCSRRGLLDATGIASPHESLARGSPRPIAQPYHVHKKAQYPATRLQWLPE